jgi:hypothetical protein
MKFRFYNNLDEVQALKQKWFRFYNNLDEVQALKQKWSSDFTTIWMKFRLLNNNEVQILQ